jgi:hypothetical protein
MQVRNVKVILRRENGGFRMKKAWFFAAVIIGWVAMSSISFGYSGWIDGKIGNALAFDGINDYVEITGYKGITGGQSRTCTAWIKTVEVTGEIITWGTDTTGNKWIIRVNENGTLRAEINGGYIYGTTVLTDGNWHHIAVTLMDDGSPDISEAQLYVDGQLETIGVSLSQIVNTADSVDVWIGAHYNQLRYYEGLIDEVCIYNRALEPNEINPETSMPTEGLVAHWAMDETEGKIAHDSISSYDGMLWYMINGYSGGSGTLENPYQIATKQDLLEFAVTTDDYDKSFILAADVDLEGQNFDTAVIAAQTGPYNDLFQGTAFSGTFDGNNHKIMNYHISQYNDYYLGLFGCITGTVKNLGLNNFNIDAYHIGYIGGLAGYNYGSIINCYSAGAVMGWFCTGGLVGYNYFGNISNCYYSGTVTGDRRTGGLVGYNYRGNISNCYSTGIVVNDLNDVGGLTGINFGGIITSCYSTCNVQGESKVGGLVGCNDVYEIPIAPYYVPPVPAYIRYCYSSGKVTGSSYVGGLVGFDDNSVIMDSYSNGLVLGSSYAGGLVGYIENSFVDDSFWDTQTSGKTTSAGGTGKTTEEMQTKTTFASTTWFGPWIIDENKNVLFFDGVDDYVEITGYKGITGGQSRTCTAWIKTVEVTGEIITWGTDTTGNKWIIRVNENGTLRAEINGGYIYGTTVLTDGNWHHIAVTLMDDGSPDISEAQLYVDGQLETVGVSLSRIVNTADSVDVWIGAHYNQLRYFEGLIDEVCIYGRALEPNEINPIISIPTEGLIAHWGMDENEGIIAHDSVSSYDGVLKNSDNQVEWSICEGMNYPRLVWQIPVGDFACPDGVNIEDLNYFVGRWLLDNCTADNNYCGGGDMDVSGKVDLADFAVLAGHWLENVSL